jgi:hypothetical protein
MVLAIQRDMNNRTNKKLHILKDKKLGKERGREISGRNIKTIT